MIYLSGKWRADVPLLATPVAHRPRLEGQVWAADTGLFGKTGAGYTDESYLAWLDEMRPYRATCLFATAPDVVAQAGPTLARSAPMYRRIRELGYRPALVAQDGLERLREFIPWPDFDVLFIGGTTAWKMGEHVRELVLEARRRGKRVHMGRVNSRSRLAYAESIGCDSADGTVLVFDQGRDVAGWVEHVVRNPSLWRPQ